MNAGHLAGAGAVLFLLGVVGIATSYGESLTGLLAGWTVAIIGAGVATSAAAVIVNRRR